MLAIIGSISVKIHRSLKKEEKGRKEEREQIH